MRISRLFNTAKATIKVSCCSECPGKEIKRYCIKGKVSMGKVCGQLIYIIGKDQYNQEIYDHPRLEDTLMYGGMRSDCPLPIEGV